MPGSPKIADSTNTGSGSGGGGYEEDVANAGIYSTGGGIGGVFRPGASAGIPRNTAKSPPTDDASYHALCTYLTSDELTQLTHTIAQRVGHYLERQGLMVRNDEHSYDTADAVDAGSTHRTLW